MFSGKLRIGFPQRSKYFNEERILISPGISNRLQSARLKLPKERGKFDTEKLVDIIFFLGAAHDKIDFHKLADKESAFFISVAVVCD